MENKKKRRIAPTADLETILPILISIWRKIQKKNGPPDVLQTREFREVVTHLLALHDGLNIAQNLVGTNWIADINLFGAYLLYDWVIHYQEGLSLFSELPCQPQRVLEVAAGAGPFALAALKHGATDVVAADRSEMALRAAAKIAGQCGYPLAVRQWDCLAAPLPLQGHFDLIALPHCLEELFPSHMNNWLSLRALFVTELLNKLTPEGFLVVVDHSTAEINKRHLMLRDKLVLEQEIAVQAPCIWRGACPALAGGTACFAQRPMEKPFLIKEFHRAAQINLSSLKMSYTIFRSPQMAWQQMGQKKVYRVITPPIDTFRGKRYYLCGVDGKKSISANQLEKSKETKAFDFLQRGDAIEVENVLENSGHMDLIEGSKLTIYSTCSKPLPAIPNEEKQKWQ